MVDTIKRSQERHFLNTGTIAEPVWSLMGVGISSAKTEMNPETTKETIITEDNARVSVDSYAPTLPIKMTAKSGDAVFDYIDAMRKARDILDAAETELVTVHVYEGAALGFYYAEKQTVSIQVDDFGGDGGKPVEINYTINFQGNPVYGGFNPTPTAEFVAAPINTILSTLVIGSVTLTPVFATDKAWLWYAGSVSNATTTVTMTSTLSGATITQYDADVVEVAQGDPASLAVGVNHLTVDVTVGTENVIYHIDITRAAS